MRLSYSFVTEIYAYDWPAIFCHEMRNSRPCVLFSRRRQNMKVIDSALRWDMLLFKEAL